MKSFSRWLAMFLCALLLVSCSNSIAVEWETPADQTPEQYAEKGYVVNQHGKITNFAEMERFIKNVNAHQPDQITSVDYTIEGDPIFQYVVYDGKQFSYVYDNSLDVFGGNGKGVKTGICSDFAIEKKDRGMSYQLTGCTGEAENFIVLFVTSNEK